MISVTAEFKTLESGRFRRVLEALKIVAKKAPPLVKVGFPAGKVAGDLISIAYWNHEGTSRAKGDVFFKNGKFGMSGPIPPRPFIQVAMYAGQGEIRTFIRAEAKAIMQGKGDIRRSLERIGIMGAQLIEDQIGSNMAPANSPMTIELKGSSATLIDTGRMRQSVTWKIDE